MSKYKQEIFRRGLDYQFVSSHEFRYKAKQKVRELKRKEYPSRLWGTITKPLNYIIKESSDGRYLVYIRYI